MLIPAICRKNEIEEAFNKYYYTDDMLYETGSLQNWHPKISEECGCVQYAIIDNEKLIGYFSYYIDWYASSASQFGLFSFDRGNSVIGQDILSEIKKILYAYKLHRIEWRMVGGNPVQRHYDKICERFNGRKLVLRDAIKDRYGKYHDDIIYEIINETESE